MARLTSSAHRRALRLRLSHLREKIIGVENEISGLGAGNAGALFESPALEFLRQRLYDLQARAAEIEAEISGE